MAAEIDEDDAILDGDEDEEDDEQASSIDDLGLPMPVLGVPRRARAAHAGRSDIVGRLWASTNNAMLCVVSLPGAGEGGAALEAACIYKPVMGERPLGDFPDRDARPGARSRRSRSRGRPAGRSSRRRSSATGRSARAWSSSGSVRILRPIRSGSSWTSIPACDPSPCSTPR